MPHVPHVLLILFLLVLVLILVVLACSDRDPPSPTGEGIVWYNPLGPPNESWLDIHFACSGQSPPSPIKGGVALYRPLGLLMILLVLFWLGPTLPYEEGLSMVSPTWAADDSDQINVLLESCFVLTRLNSDLTSSYLFVIIPILSVSCLYCLSCLLPCCYGYARITNCSLFAHTHSLQYPDCFLCLSTCLGCVT